MVLYFFWYSKKQNITKILHLNYKCIKTIDFEQKKDKILTELY